MRIELAPMEGITSYVYRNAINTFYGGIDTYFTPFISTHKDKELNFKEKKEINPDNNIGINLIPQVLTSDADEFLYTSGQIAEYGYNHVNINFGCPSGTVTTKRKGAGALLDLQGLEKLLDKIFSNTDLQISIKTRIGYTDKSEWENILEVYKKFPITELIVHGRVREQFYKGVSDAEFVAQSIKALPFKVSYNGDIFSVSDYLRVEELMPSADAFMLGRGLIATPWLAGSIKKTSQEADINVFKEFNHALIEGYDKIMPGEKNTLFKLKELWIYMIRNFEETGCAGSDFSNPNPGKILKKIRKCNSLREYETIINGL